MKKPLSALLVTAMFVGLLTGCSQIGPKEGQPEDVEPDVPESEVQDGQKELKQPEPSMDKAYTLTVDPNYESALVYTVQRNSGDPVLNMGLTGDIKMPAQRGFSFVSWCYDAQGAEPVGETDILDGDATIYAKWEAWDEDTKAWMDLVLAEAEQARYICNRPTAYTKESFETYQGLSAPIMFLTMGGSVFPKEMEGLIYGVADARQKLELAPGISDPEESIWYIWGEDMPQAPEAGQYNYYGTWDNEGFAPFLVPYMLADQSQVKGNLILVSGGGFQQRANRWEGYPGAEIFNGLGYNCFVLQRRVEPSTPVDSGLDLQRAVRYLKYHADDYGIARIDNLAAAGYSGGGTTVQIAVEQFYGDIQPTVIYSDYQCDEVDAMNSDLSTMILIYSAQPLETDNPNIPDAFVVNGTEDEYVSLYDNSYEAVKYYREKGVRYEIHFFADAAHGFGQGFGLNATSYTDEDVKNVKIWPSLADTFMQIQYGEIQNIETIEQ
ncbi:MAG: hypothetical protein HFI42_04115 [Lachnospiraceae bacterium]|nr:hypothetical protein [Lachnospiraceae bacterium]